MKQSLIIAAFAASAATLWAGDVTGVVTLKGTPPPEKVNTAISADANCGKLVKGPVMSRLYVVGAQNGLGNVFVYVKAGAEGKKGEAPAKTVVDQVGCLYEPYVSGAMAGSPVEFRNSDPVLHNIAFLKSNSGNETFNSAQGAGSKPLDKVFKNPEVMVKLQCSVHPWMFGYIGVVDHPFFAVTDKDGKYTIKGLPPGKYTLAFVHLKASPNGEVTQEIEVKDSGATANATLEVPAPK